MRKLELEPIGDGKHSMTFGGVNAHMRWNSDVEKDLLEDHAIYAREYVRESVIDVLDAQFDFTNEERVAAEKALDEYANNIDRQTHGA